MTCAASQLSNICMYVFVYGYVYACVSMDIVHKTRCLIILQLFQFFIKIIIK